MKSKLWGLLIILLFLFPGIITISCDLDQEKNPFEDTTWWFEESHSWLGTNYSKLGFTSKTWSWDGHIMMNTVGSYNAFNFKGNYTYKNNQASMISSHYCEVNSSWTPWKGAWTATLTEDGTRITIIFNGEPRSIYQNNKITEKIEFIGYRVYK